MLIEKINKSWGWKGFTAKEIILVNSFGNIIFKCDNDNYWRICPEEVECEKIASTKEEMDKLLQSDDFKEDWEMENLILLAKNKLGELKPNEKYALKLLAILGGEYDSENLCKIPFEELISFSGYLAFKTKDLEDGAKIKITIN